MRDIRTILDLQTDSEVIHVPEGDFEVWEPIVLDGRVIVGEHRHTRLHLAPGVTGIVLKSHPGKSRRWNAEFDSTAKMWAGVEGIVIAGNRQGQIGIATEGPCDQVLIENVQIYDCDAGVLFGDENGFIRESSVRGLVCDRCGSETLPAVGLHQRVNKSGDGNNHMRFTDCRLVYSRGVAFQIRNDDIKERVRGITFDGFLHMQTAAEKDVKRYPLVVCEGVGRIQDMTVRAEFRGDSTGNVRAIIPGKAENSVFIGTFFGSNPGTVIKRY
jgi:hypothetical protein